MKLNKSCYDAAVSHVTVRRYGLFGLLYTIGIILLVVGSLNSDRAYGNAAADIRSLCAVIPVCNLAYAAALAQLLLGDLYTPRLSYALRSLPITLGGWYGTQVVLGIVSVIPGIVISGITLSLMLTAYKATILIFMADAFLSFLAFYGMALLCGVCAGNRIGMLLLYCIINFVGIFYGWAVMHIFSPLVYGLYLPNFIPKSVPVALMLKKNSFDLTYRDNVASVRTAEDYFASIDIEAVTYNNSLWTMLGFAVAGCVLIGLGMVLLRRRKPECAGDLLAFPQLKPVILLICTLCTGILFHIISNFFGWDIQLPMLFVGIILGYYAALMLLKRQTSVFTKKALVPLALMLLFCFGGITATGLNLWGITYRVPDAAAVEKVEIDSNGSGTLVGSDPETIEMAIRLQQESLDDHRQLERARPLLTRIYGSEDGTPQELIYQDGVLTARFSICYTLKNGHELNRMYTVRSSYDSIKPLKDAYSAPEYVFTPNLLADNKQFDRAYLLEQLKYVQLSCYHSGDELYGNRRVVIADEDTPGLVDAILKDCDEGTMARMYLFHAGERCTDDIRLCYDVAYSGEQYTAAYSLNLFTGCTNTMQYLIDHGYHDAIETE